MAISKRKSDGGRVKIFAPPKDDYSDLRKYHPELNRIEEFKPLLSWQMAFVWSYVMLFRGVKDKGERIRLSIERAFGGKESVPPLEYDLFVEKMEIPSSVAKAIEKMNSFDIPSRLTARYITESTFVAYQKIISMTSNPIEAFSVKRTDKDGNVVTEVDYSKMKQYVDATTTINKSLPELIAKLEEGYGFGKSGFNAKDSMDSNYLDKWHNNKH